MHRFLLTLGRARTIALAESLHLLSWKTPAQVAGWADQVVILDADGEPDLPALARDAGGIVKAHRGSIQFESKEGAGTTFRVAFPTFADDEPAKTVPVVEVKAASGASRAPQLLLVDDEVQVRELARRALEQSGFKVLTAGNGREAVELFTQHLQGVDAVVMDLLMPVMNGANFHPFMPTGLTGVAGAAASIFFAYVGFDAVSTAAEETKNPQRNVPIGLIASLLFCTVFYLLVSAGAIGSPLGAQPVRDAAGVVLSPGTSELTARCQAIVAGGAAEPLSCSKEALAHVLRTIGWEKIGNLIGLAATLALPSVVLMMMFGQTRVFFTMARDGLLPEKLAEVHPKWKTPYIVTALTGVVVVVAAAFLPVGALADIANAGTLYAFFMVAIAVMMLRKSDPQRKRPFTVPGLMIVGPLTILGTLFLFLNLPFEAMMVLPVWSIVGPPSIQ